MNVTKVVPLARDWKKLAHEYRSCEFYFIIITIIIKRLHDSYTLSNGCISFNLILWWRQSNWAFHVCNFACWFQSDCVSAQLITISIAMAMAKAMAIASSDEVFALVSFEYSLIMYLKHIANVHANATYEMSCSMQSSDVCNYYSYTTFPCMHACM